ncbi:hypothetical protein KY284_020200 [Solanum tuberosum]|nr:hypothetical protein KY284_020200 [Solanum tuberosum]
MHLHLAQGDIAQLVELYSCNWIIAIMGPKRATERLYLDKDGRQERIGGRMGSLSDLDRTWTVVGVSGSPRVPSSEISGEKDQVGPCKQLDALSPFNPLSECNKRKGRKIHGPTPSSPRRRNYEITPKMPSASRGHGPTIVPCSISGTH